MASSGAQGSSRVLTTAGAVPVKNLKGEISMQKVKVTRYVAGKAPVFAKDHSDSDYSVSSDEEDSKAFQKQQARRAYESSETVDFRGKKSSRPTEPRQDEAAKDSRFRRIQQSKQERNFEDRDVRHRLIHDPEVVPRRAAKEEPAAEPYSRARRHRSPESSDEGDDDDLSDEEYERRRSILRQRTMEKRREEEVLARQQDDEEEEESEEEEDSEYEEYTDSEDETAPQLKPVFVRKRDRVTLQETEKEQQRLKELQLEEKRRAEERRKASVKLVEDLVKKELEMEKRTVEDNYDLASVQTDDENEELAYESWKIRELKRIKRDKEEREALLRDKAEWEKVHNMTEDERRAYLRTNPKLVTNKQTKGKYKFLQKYYHRGAFFLNEEDEVYKQNFAEPTLEDHFDKSILPKVMQVKDFGKAGRTKWTHLVAEDTTDFQSAWVADSAQNIKFFTKHAAGVKDVFDRPAKKKKKF